jgi:uncharacterized membrane protein YphA (DoxX/SURF4 family)
MFSGAHKLSAYPLNSTAEQVSQLEIPLPSALALVVLLVELLCGLALVIGLFTRWFSVPLALGMLVDVVFFHWPSPLFFDSHGFESAFMRLGASVTLVLTGSGKAALDNTPFSRNEEAPIGGPGRRRLGLIIFGVVVVVALGALGSLSFTNEPRLGTSEPAGVESFDNLSRTHAYDSVTYEQSPPVGGNHNPVWQNAGFYEEPVPNEKAVHTLEHGAVWITYSQNLPQDQKEKLRQLAESKDCLLASPYPDLPTPVVASAWGKQLQLKSIDDPELQEFIHFYRKGPQTPEPGASCTGATEVNPPPKDSNQ